MQTLDVVIRGGTVVTAADTTVCDVGIRGGRIVALGHDLGPAQQTIDAKGAWCCRVASIVTFIWRSRRRMAP